MKANSFDIEFAESIIAKLEAGTAPWVRPWAVNEARMKPYANAITGNEYTGANIIRLYCTCEAKGYEDYRWMTYKQAQEKGWQVRKGEKGTHISFFKQYMKNGENTETGETETKTFFALKSYTVFNAEQVDGIEALPATPTFDWTPVEKGEEIIRMSKANIEHRDKDRACYIPSLDVINLPLRETFKTVEGYYATAIHELAHWAMNERRLNLSSKDVFGSADYAREELRAEIASWMIAAETGLPFNPENHASYIKSWVKAIKEDHREIFRACADADKVKRYLLGIEDKA